MIGLSDLNYKVMQINKSAPLTANQQIEINSSKEHVWQTLTDIKKWPEWQPGVDLLNVNYPLETGSIFEWKANGLKIASTIKIFHPNQEIIWTGQALGMQAIHRWFLEEQNGITIVTTEESLNGWMAWLINIFDKNYLNKSLSKTLKYLKQEVEN